MGGSSSKPKWTKSVYQAVQASFPKPPTAAELAVMRNNKKHELITSLRSRRDAALKTIVDSLRGKRLTGNYAPLLSFDGKDYWLYVSIGDVPAHIVLPMPPPPPAPPVTTGLGAAAATAVKPPPPVPTSITAYEHIKYKGKSRTFNIGKYNKMPGGFNNNISSLRVPKGRIVTVYTLKDFQGYKKTFSSDAPDLTSVHFEGGFRGTWNDKISSMIVE